MIIAILRLFSISQCCIINIWGNSVKIQKERVADALIQREFT
jgi:hypothetical protein